MSNDSAFDLDETPIPQPEDRVVVVREAAPAERSQADKIDDAIASIEKLKAYYSKIRAAAIHVTSTRDWTRWGDNYRLNESGAAKIMAQLGVNEETIETRRVNDTWGYTYYVTRRYVPSWNPGASFDAVGSCRSDDGFFASRKKWDDNTQKMVPYTLPPEEVDESNILKSALANTRVNGIISVCGLKTVNISELSSAPNIDVEKIDSVSFGKGSVRGGSFKGPSEKQVAFIKKLGGNEAKAKGCKTYRDLQAYIDGLKAGEKDVQGGEGGSFF